MLVLVVATSWVPVRLCSVAVAVHVRRRKRQHAMLAQVLAQVPTLGEYHQYSFDVETRSQNFLLMFVPRSPLLADQWVGVPPMMPSC